MKHSERFPWLVFTGAGFGCSVCRKAEVHNLWGKQAVPLNEVSMRVTSLTRHQGSLLHTEALKKQNVINGTVVPPISMFQEAHELLTSEGCLSVKHLAKRLKRGRSVASDIKE